MKGGQAIGQNLGGFTVGTYLRLPLSPLFSIQPEILYTQKGAKGTFTLAGSGIISQRVVLEYIEIPVLFKYKIFPFFAIYGGPYVGLSTSSKATNTTSNTTTDISQSIENSDWGAVIGGSFQIFRLVLDLRYSLGLTNITTLGSDPNYRHGTMTIMASYNFPVL